MNLDYTKLYSFNTRHKDFLLTSMANQISSNEAPEQRLITMWNRFGGNVWGRKLFSYVLGRTAPYSGSIRAEVLSLTPGSVQVVLKDRRSVRNHLNSVHAIALANLGELASGLAMISAVPANTRAIVVNLDIEYLKKARGKLIAEGSATPPDTISESVNSVALAEIKDAEGDTVSRVKVNWRLSPKESQDGKGDKS
jgi:acyl-coenzyme A thioesterase PaaI-like protein